LKRGKKTRKKGLKINVWGTGSCWSRTEGKKRRKRQGGNAASMEVGNKEKRRGKKKEGRSADNPSPGGKAATEKGGRKIRKTQPQREDR